MLSDQSDILQVSPKHGETRTLNCIVSMAWIWLSMYDIKLISQIFQLRSILTVKRT